jgi:hypothetical protein
MQKWEYLQVDRARGTEPRQRGEHYQIAELKWGIWINTSPNKKVEWKGELIDLLNELGDQGWRLVSAWPRSSIMGGDFPPSSSPIIVDYAGFTSHETWVFTRPRA